MFDTLPRDAQSFMDWPWERIQPYFEDLAARDLSEGTVDQFLRDWTQLSDLLRERGSRLSLATAANTADEEAKRRYVEYVETVSEPVQPASQRLKEKLLASGIIPAGFEIPLRKMRSVAEIYRDANVPLETQLSKLELEYDEVVGAQTVEWEGEEVTVTQLAQVLQETDRSRREAAWRAMAERQLRDRDTINHQWVRGLELRRQVAANADLPDFRAYCWAAMCRFDYTPEDCRTFHEAIEKVVVPVARRLLERRGERLGVDSLRPWDLDVDPLGREPLRPFSESEELAEGGERVFYRLDPVLGDCFRTMRVEGLMDLPNRKNKAPGAFCTSFPVAKRPFIFLNATGRDADVRTLLHECGHAFHVFESSTLPYAPLRSAPMEFAEVASMAMELLAEPYLTRDQGGFYSADEANRAFAAQLEKAILFWPYMAVVDAFQHWVYENPDQASDPATCDATWTREWNRFMPVVDYTGLEDNQATGWHRKPHIHVAPFYYVEYGLAQLGAVQVWQGALEDSAGAVQAYRRALALGGSVSLPKLFETAGARFAFDAETLGAVVATMETKLLEAEAV